MEMYPFLHVFSKHLSSSCCVSNIVPDTGDSKINKKHSLPSMLPTVEMRQARKKDQLNYNVTCKNQLNHNVTYKDQLNYNVTCKDQLNYNVTCKDQLNYNVTGLKQTLRTRGSFIFS